jgi:alcohol dehydrogenase
VLTGVGAVVNAARVMPGQSVAVFGLGGVGLSAVMGAKLAGASQLIVVDKLASKFDLARRVGADHAIDASTTDPAKTIAEMTGGGVDYAFEAVGSAAVLATAFASVRRGGTVVSIGLPHPSQQLSIPVVPLVAQEKSIRGCYMGSSVPSRDIPRYIDLYRRGALPVDALFSGSIGLDEINTGFDRLSDGAVIRQLIKFH